MAQNINPIFTLVPHVSWATVTSANTAMDGTGSVSTAFTAGANGSFLAKLSARALGSNVATTLRIFVNNGSTNATPANNSLVMELGLPATTASNNTSQPDYQQPLQFALPSPYVINLAIGTAAAAGWAITIFGGDY